MTRQWLLSCSICTLLILLRPVTIRLQSAAPNVSIGDAFEATLPLRIRGISELCVVVTQPPSVSWFVAANASKTLLLNKLVPWCAWLLRGALYVLRLRLRLR